MHAIPVALYTQYGMYVATGRICAPNPPAPPRTCWFQEVSLDAGSGAVASEGAHDHAGHVPRTTLFALEDTIAQRRAALAQPQGGCGGAYGCGVLKTCNGTHIVRHHKCT